jgi:8-oxo-dGTP diphosphatase
LFTPFPDLETAQAFAVQHGLRQRAIAYITRDGAQPPTSHGATPRGRAYESLIRTPELLVFDHTPDHPTAGTQVPAGGLEAGETPLEGALREAREETGLEALTPRTDLGSGLYENGLLRQIWHFSWLETNAPTPDAWEHRAEAGPDTDGYTFLHHFEPLETTVLHYDLDAMLPRLWAALGYTVKEKAVCFITRGKSELLILENHKDGGAQVVRGNLEHDETPSDAAKRELLEEAGLELGEPVSLGVSAFRLTRGIRDKYPATHPKHQHLWYYHHFHFTAPSQTPDTWTHRVSAGSSDHGSEYHLRFQPLETAELTHDMNTGLRALQPHTSRTPLRPCVVCYITRGPPDALELLVFTGHPWGGVQVIAGGIDPGETAAQAATREILEESGLHLTGGTFLGRHDYYHRLETAQVYEARYVFHFHVPHELPDTWTHRVSSGDADVGLEYRFAFVRLEDARLDWELDEFLMVLRTSLDTARSII